MTEPPRQIAVVACSSDIHKALRARREQLNAPLNVLDDIGCFPDGQTSKWLAEPPIKHFTVDSMLELAGTLGVGVVLVEDPHALERTLRHPDFRTRDALKVRRGLGHWRNARLASMIEEILMASRQRGGRAAWDGMTKKQRSKEMARRTRLAWRTRRRKQKLAKSQARAAPRTPEARSR